MSKPLTTAAVRNLKPAKNRLEIPDGACGGLYLVIEPSGAKRWALRYRRPDRRPAKLVLGSVVVDPTATELDVDPAIGGYHTLAAAHRLVGKLQHEIAMGRDPGAAHIKGRAQQRIAAKAAADNTFAAAARDFVEQHARKKVRRWKEVARLLGVDPETVAPFARGLADRWAARQVSEIDGHDIYSIVDEVRRLGVPGLERRSDGPTESRARSMYAALSKLFSWLLQHRRVTANPCSTVHKPDTAKPRDRVLEKDEIVVFWNSAEESSAPFDAVLKLLLLTGCRLREISELKYSEIKSDENILDIPGTRTKNRKPFVVPLSPLARGILQNVKRIEGCDYVFSTNGKTPVSGWSKLKDRLDENMKLATPWRLHDLRRTASTGMNKLRIMPHVVEAVLNHISGSRGGVAGVYNKYEYLEEKTEALHRWGAHIEGLLTNNSVVVPMKKAQRS